MPLTGAGIRRRLRPQRRLRREVWCRRKLRQLHPLVRRPLFLAAPSRSLSPFALSSSCSQPQPLSSAGSLGVHAPLAPWHGDGSVARSGAPHSRPAGSVAGRVSVPLLSLSVGCRLLARQASSSGPFASWFFVGLLSCCAVLFWHSHPLTYVCLAGSVEHRG
jgi:hypothetical protein